jgi:hypothetical protein
MKMTAMLRQLVFSILLSLVLLWRTATSFHTHSVRHGSPHRFIGPLFRWTLRLQVLDEGDVSTIDKAATKASSNLVSSNFIDKPNRAKRIPKGEDRRWKTSSSNQMEAKLALDITALKIFKKVRACHTCQQLRSK